MKHFIKKLLREALKEQSRVFDFNSLPDDVKKTLFDEYDRYTMKTFDWNEKMRELGQPAFSEWFTKQTNKVISDNIDNIIRDITQDMILLKKQDMSERKLKAFEELIKPVLGDSVLVPALSKFEEEILLDPYLTPEKLQKAYREAKNIMDKKGNLDHSKIEQSEIFVGGDISLPNFERFAEENPEYKGVFKDWKKLFDNYMDLSIQDLNAYRSSTPIERMRKLRDTLIDIKKNKLTERLREYHEGHGTDDFPYSDEYVEATLRWYEPNNIEILDWNSKGTKRGGTEITLKRLRDKYDSVVAVDCGYEHENSYKYWEHMLKKGLIDGFYDDHCTFIDDTFYD